jgi:sarcosine oxidase subunit beta
LLPHLHTADLVGATYSPNGGTYDARSVALGYLQRALELGVRLRRRSAVVGFEIRHEQVYAVHTHTNTIACNVVVNAAGPWAGQVAAYAGLELPVRPHSQSIYAAAPIAHIPPTAPMVVDVASGFFLRRSDDGLFLGRYRDDVPADVLADVDWDGFDEVLAAGRHRLPPLQQISLNHDRCRVGLCEQTPDASPVLGRHPDVPSYIDASGFSDHSVMSAPAAGMLIAEEILDGRAHTIDIDDLRVGRFLSVLRQKEHGAI